MSHPPTGGTIQSMKAPTIATFTLTLTLAVGCDWSPGWGDPCSTNHPSQADPAVKADCQACNQSPCPDETGESGDDSPPLELLCASEEPQQSDTSICYVLPLTATPSHTASDDVDVPASNCPFLSTPVPCERSWSDPWSGSQECSICNLTNFNSEYAHVEHPVNGPGPWNLCPNPSPSAPNKYVPAQLLSDSADPSQPIPDWLETAECYYGDIDDTWTHSCSPVHMQGSNLGSAFIESGGTWTCSCENDSDCAPGSVCQAGWVFDGFANIPRPTLCVWDDGSGSANGIAPEGPEVYGLTQWSDGIDVNGDDIVISAGMLLAMAPREGKPFALLNDDQRIDERGTITHCGAGSLCEHVGLQVGERLVVPSFDFGAMLAGEPLYIEVQRHRERSRWLAIWLDI